MPARLATELDVPAQPLLRQLVCLPTAHRCRKSAAARFDLEERQHCRDDELGCRDQLLVDHPKRAVAASLEERLPELFLPPDLSKLALDALGVEPRLGPRP